MKYNDYLIVIPVRFYFFFYYLCFLVVLASLLPFLFDLLLIWTVVLSVCLQLILFFLWLSATGTPLYMFLLSHKQTVKRTDANTGPNLGTETVSWANHPQCSTPSLGPPPFLLCLLPFFSRFLFIWSICVSFSQCESVDSGSFWAGVWSCVLSSIANKPSVISIPRSVCVFCDLVLVCFCLHSSAHTFVFISRCCLTISTFTLAVR